MFCTNCGARLQDGSRFCPACGTPANASAGEAAPTPAAAPEAGPEPQPRDNAFLAKAFRAALAAHPVPSRELLVTGDAITPKLLNELNFAIPADETALMVLDGRLAGWMGLVAKPFRFGKTSASVFAVTDKAFRYVRLIQDSFMASFSFKGAINGAVALQDVKTLAVGDMDHAYGTSYIGHQLVLNGQVLGLARISKGMMADERAIDYLNLIFGKVFAS